MFKSIFLLSASLVLLAGSARGGEVEDTLRTYDLDPVVITGTRIEVARSNVPLTVSTVSGPTIESAREANLLPVLSRRVPGLFVTERGMIGYGIADGSAGQIRIRGVGGSPTTNVLVLVDGHPQFMGIFGHPFPDAYVSSDAERVEVIRGPASVLYGTGAMGGVINIITTRVRPEGLQGTASAAYGSFGTQHYSASGGMRRSGREVFASVNHDRTDGHRVQDDFWLTNGYLKVGSPIARGWRASADGRVTRFRTEDPGPVSDPVTGEDHWADVLRARGSLSFENNYARSEGAVRAFINYGDHDIYDGFRSEDFHGGVMAYQGIRFSPAGVATLGAEWKRYGGSSRNILGEVDFGEHAVSEVGGYGLLQYAIRPHFFVTAGARVDNHSEFGAEAAPQLGVAYQFLPGTTFKGSVAKGFRSPTILELYLFPPANPDLRPERMWNYEVGVVRVGERYQAEIVGFVSEGTNLIQVEGVFPNVRRQNTGKFSHFGFEFQTTYAATDRLTIHGNLSHLDTGDRPVVGAPEWHGFADLSYSTGRWGGGIEFERVSLTVSPHESYSLLNLRAFVEPVRAVQVFVRTENLLDESYQINAGYPMPGTSIMMGARARY